MSFNHPLQAASGIKTLGIPNRGRHAPPSLKKQKHSVFLVSILLPPLSLWLGGFIGATTAAAVARAPAMHVALISFGIAALLFLVTEELLLEAHEAVSTRW